MPSLSWLSSTSSAGAGVLCALVAPMDCNVAYLGFTVAMHMLSIQLQMRCIEQGWRKRVLPHTTLHSVLHVCATNLLHVPWTEWRPTRVRIARPPLHHTLPAANSPAPTKPPMHVPASSPPAAQAAKLAGCPLHSLLCAPYLAVPPSCSPSHYAYPLISCKALHQLANMLCHLPACALVAWTCSVISKLHHDPGLMLSLWSSRHVTCCSPSQTCLLAVPIMNSAVRRQLPTVQPMQKHLRIRRCNDPGHRALH